jgi:hypothetical protein
MTKSKIKPRTVRSAKRQGWRVVTAKNYSDKNVSWVGLMIWSDRMLKGNYVQSYSNHEFAFEREEDASHFLMKWCI